MRFCADAGAVNAAAKLMAAMLIKNRAFRRIKKAPLSGSSSTIATTPPTGKSCAKEKTVSVVKSDGSAKIYLWQPGTCMEISRVMTSQSVVSLREQQASGAHATFVHHRLRTGQAQHGAEGAQTRQDRLADRYARGGGVAAAGLFQAGARGLARRCRHRLRSFAKARHAGGRPRRGAR